MTIREIRVERHRIPLTHTYTVAYGTKEVAELFTVDIATDDHVGHGSGTPSLAVTGVDADATARAFDEVDLVAWHGRSTGDFGAALEAGLLAKAPAARAAIDIAMWDLVAKAAGVPLVERLGRVHDALPTSVTIGIGDVAHTLEEAKRHVDRGFHTLKVKIGHDLEVDLERLAKLREVYGDSVAIRVDANQGYTREMTEDFATRAAAHTLEFIEQPMPPAADGELHELTDSARGQLVMDESIQELGDVDRIAANEPPVAGINIKLMKSGGISPSRQIAQRADERSLALMWGCMDETCASIAAALHLAYASPNTRWIDLDGSFDLSSDPYVGGFPHRRRAARADRRRGAWRPPGLSHEIPGDRRPS